MISKNDSRPATRSLWIGVLDPDKVVRRYMSTESLAKSRLEAIEGEAEEVKAELVAASLRIKDDAV